MTGQPEAMLLAADLEMRPASYARDMQIARLLREQHAEIERLRADAERYRWLREKSCWNSNFYNGEPKWMVSREQGGMGQNFFGAEIDVAIDRAVAEEREP